MFGNKERPYLRLVESPQILKISEEELEPERRDYFVLFLLTNISPKTDQPLEEAANIFLRRFFDLKSHFTYDRSVDEREAWIVRRTNLESLLEISQVQLQYATEQCQILPQEANAKALEIASLYVFRWNRIKVVLTIAKKMDPPAIVLHAEMPPLSS